MSIEGRDEIDRLAALDRYAVMDTPADPRFDRLTRLAASIFEVPIAVITLIDSQRQWFKSRVGLTIAETSREVAFCSHTIRGDGVLVVEDTHLDSRFVDNPLVTGEPHLRFYAGVPLRSADGHNIGTIAILDHVPRRFDLGLAARLTDFAALAEDELELLRMAALAERARARGVAHAERRFQALVEGAPDVTFLLDDGGVCVYASPGVSELLGRPPEAFVGVGCDVPHANGARTVAELRHADGSLRIVEVTARDLRDDAAVRAVVLNCRDVTERARRERRERRIAELGIEGLRARDVEAFAAAAARIAAEELGAPVEVRRAGDTVSLEVAPPASPGDASFLGAVSAVVASVVGEARARRELAEAEEQLRHAQKMEAVGRLAGGIAHDFNNLLTVILGGAAFLGRRLPPGPLVDEVQQIRGAAERAAGLTRQILAFSRRQVVRGENLDVNEVISGLLAMLDRALGEMHAIELALSPARLVVHADRGQLEQIVLNLCVNARDALPDGGMIVIRSGAAQRERPMVWIEVADGGTGMTPEVVARLFEPFFTTKELGKGTGLGLATVYGIVKQHGGTIDVDSAPGQGSRFTVYLPAAAGEPTVPAADRTAPRAGHETVLVAEDDPAVRRIAVRALEQGGYRVLVASDGEEALAVFRANAAEIAVVVLDVVMPRRGGPSALLEMRALRPGLRAIFCSGYAGEDHPQHGGAKLPADDPWLQKPYEPDRLLDEVRRAIDR